METDSRVLKHLPWGLGVAAFVLYVLTGARTIQWQDSAQFTERITTGSLDNIYGLAMTHPLHFMLGRYATSLFPAHIPWALSGVSALGGALAVGLTTACCREWTRRTGPAVFAGLTLMLAHTFWRFSCLPEVYTWSAALLMAQVLIVIRAARRHRPVAWPLLLLLNGMAWSNHNLALLTLSVWGVWFLICVRSTPSLWRKLPLMGIFWVIGSLPYTLLILREGLLSGNWGATVHSALFGHGFREQVSGLAPNPAFAAISLAFLVLSFPGLALPLAVRSRLEKAPAVPRVLYAVLFVHLLFFLRYNVIDQYTFLIPVYPIVALLAGAGWARLSAPRLKRAAWILLMLQIPFYALAPSLARATGVLKPFARNKPFRDDAEYLLWPWRVQDTSADQLARAALEAAQPEGVVVVADPMAQHTLRWMRRHLGFEHRIRLLSAQQHEEMLAALQQGERLVWAPLRSTDVVPTLWQEKNGVWIAETGAILPSTPASDSPTLEP